MRKSKYDYFSIWLGITIVGIVMLFFLVVTKFQPDFFQNMTFVL